MAPHPSLAAPFIGPPLLEPKVSMGRNDLCWCLSGLKWKKCHYERENQTPLNIFEFEEGARRRAQRGYCSHADGVSATTCSQKIVRAHTVQRRGGLRAIADDKSRVLSVMPSMRRLIDHKGYPPPVERGIGDASVFPGFCEAHDTTVFKPIEGRNVGLTEWEALLFTYRAIAYERFTKAGMIENLAIQRGADRGRPFPIQAALQQHLHVVAAGAREGLTEVNAQLAEYRRRAKAKDCVGFRFRAFRFDRVLPIVACGGYMPEIALDGTLLQQIARGERPAEQIALTITSYEGQSVAMFGWLGTEEGPCGDYISSIEQLPNSLKADAIIQVAFEQLENIFLRIGWWASLSDDQKSDLTIRIRSGVGPQLHPPGYYRTGGPLLTDAKIVERRASNG